MRWLKQIPKRLLLWLIQFYRVAISPMHRPCCRYIPTCSQYAQQAIQKYGAIKGGYLALRRILRCNPFSKGGYDPVPRWGRSARLRRVGAASTRIRRGVPIRLLPAKSGVSP